MDVAATLSTLDMVDPVPTNGTPWDAVLTWSIPGVDGNAGQLVVTGDVGAGTDGNLITVRDNEVFDPFSYTWSPAPGVIGVQVAGVDLLVTRVADIESAINATSTLAQVTTPDPDGAQIVSDAMEAVTYTGAFSGGENDPKYRRMLIALLPPGRVWRFVGSILTNTLTACADELSRVDRRVTNLLDEADPSTAVELLDEYERDLDLETASTTGERQARIVARRIARQRYRPVDFQNALAPLLGLDPVDVEVIETSHAQAVAMGDVREIFRFFIYRDPGLPGAYYLDSAQELADQIKPSHTACSLIESDDFLCDDPYSLCDRDLLGG